MRLYERSACSHQRKKLQTNEMKLTAAYQLCDHGSSLVPVTAEKKKREIELELAQFLIHTATLVIQDYNYMQKQQLPWNSHLPVVLASLTLGPPSPIILQLSLQLFCFCC